MRIGFAARPVQPTMWLSTKSFKITLERMTHICGFLEDLEIDFWRFPSKMFPVIEKEYATEYKGQTVAEKKKVLDIEQVRPEIYNIEHLARLFEAKDVRTCVHASMYCNPTSIKKDVVDRSILEIEVLAYFLKHFGSGWVETRLGPLGDTREGAFERFEDFYERISENAKKHIVLENDSDRRMFGTAQDLIELHDTYGVKIVFDAGNFARNVTEPHSEFPRYFNSFMERWEIGTPVVHYDNLTEASMEKKEIDVEEFWEFCLIFGENLDFDVMLNTSGREFDVIRVKNYAVENGIGGADDEDKNV